MMRLIWVVALVANISVMAAPAHEESQPVVPTVETPALTVPQPAPAIKKDVASEKKATCTTDRPGSSAGYSSSYGY